MRQTATKAVKAADHRSGCLSVGGGMRGIMKTACSGDIHELGGCFSASSIAVIPSDHRSAFALWPAGFRWERCARVGDSTRVLSGRDHVS